MKRFWVVIALSLLALAGSAGFGLEDAKGAANPYSPKEICGKRFNLVKSAPLRLFGRPRGRIRGRVVLMRRPGTMHFCIATIKNRWVGRPSITIVRHRHPTVERSARYKYFAGPVKWYHDGCKGIAAYMFAPNFDATRSDYYVSYDAIKVGPDGRLSSCRPD